MQFIHHERKTICLLKDRYSGKIFSGKSQCHENDKYDPTTGVILAFARAKAKELKYNIKDIQSRLEIEKELLQMTENNISHLTNVLKSLNKQLEICQEKQ